MLYDLTHRRYWSRNLAGCMGWLSLVKDILYSTSRYPIFVRFLRSRLRIAVRQPASYFQILALKEALATRESMLHVRRQTTIFTTSSMTPTQWHIPAPKPKFPVHHCHPRRLHAPVPLFPQPKPSDLYTTCGTSTRPANLLTTAKPSYFCIPFFTTTRSIGIYPY